MKKLSLFMAALSLVAGTLMLTGCAKTVKPGDVRGYDNGEQYISMWVHTIEDTPEGSAYKKSVESFNEKYPNVAVDVQLGGSSTGIKNAQESILPILSLFREMTAAADILTKLTHLLCREICRML